MVKYAIAPLFVAVTLLGLSARGGEPSSWTLPHRRAGHVSR